MLTTQILRYGLVGLLNTSVGVAFIFFFMAVLHAGEVAANAAGYGAGFVVSYGLNRSWTFQHDGAVGRSLWKYAIVVAASYVVNLGAMLLALRGVGLDPFLSQAIGIGAYTVLVFLGSRHFCFPGTVLLEGDSR